MQLGGARRRAGAKIAPAEISWRIALLRVAVAVLPVMGGYGFAKKDFGSHCFQRVK
jgi:hypothetical protein